MDDFKEMLQSKITDFFKDNPNTSPIHVLSKLPPQLHGIASGIICVMRESEKSLVVTGEDVNGVLLSVA